MRSLAEPKACLLGFGRVIGVTRTNDQCFHGKAYSVGDGESYSITVEGANRPRLTPSRVTRYQPFTDLIRGGTNTSSAENPCPKARIGFRTGKPLTARHEKRLPRVQTIGKLIEQETGQIRPGNLLTGQLVRRHNVPSRFGFRQNAGYAHIRPVESAVV